MATHRVLKRYPYNIISVHELKERDVKHVEYCRWFRGVITANGEDIMDVTFFIVEAWFHLSGQQQKQPCSVSD
jgi:hypothetical protein